MHFIRELGGELRFSSAMYLYCNNFRESNHTVAEIQNMDKAETTQRLEEICTSTEEHEQGNQERKHEVLRVLCTHLRHNPLNGSLAEKVSNYMIAEPQRLPESTYWFQRISDPVFNKPEEKRDEKWLQGYFASAVLGATPGVALMVSSILYGQQKGDMIVPSIAAVLSLPLILIGLYVGHKATSKLRKMIHPRLPK